ncbi:MAG TPA: alpha/beta hydrolase [Roseiflexaceae bacterium]|nr:alpha/beta hydrolase [Roseiflexaceae bacterium]
MHQITISGEHTPAAAQPRPATLRVENIPIYLVDQGDGPPTLLLHGIFDSADTWAGVTERLRGSFRILAPDLPGFGRSGAPAEFDAGLPHLAQFVESLLAEIGIAEPINLVGFDIGATYGLAWAVTHPTKVRRLAIFNSNFFSDYEWHPWAKLWRIPILGDLVMAGVTETAFARQLPRTAPHISPEQARAAARLVTPAAKRMALRHYRALDSANFRGWEDRLRELTAKVPTLVAWGDKDPYVSPAWAERFGAQEVHHFPEHSHWLPLEAPEELSKLLGAFLAAERA